jgi:hypothetical protein
MNFKSILFAAAVGLITLGVVPEAKAGDCHTDAGFRICSEYVSSNGPLTTWNFTLTNRHITEHMQVICNGSRVYDWESRGGASQSEAQTLAELFCEL